MLMINIRTRQGMTLALGLWTRVEAEKEPAGKWSDAATCQDYQSRLARRALCAFV